MKANGLIINILLIILSFHLHVISFAYGTQLNPLSANITKWSNTLNCLSMFDHFVGLALKGLNPATSISVKD